MRTFLITLLTILAAVVSCFHILKAENGVEELPNPCEAEIGRLLYNHDRCELGWQNPDSVSFYTAQALLLAYDCYGMDSEKYVDIFTNYFLHDIRNSKELICDEVYPLVVRDFNPFTPWISRLYYRLADIMEDLGDYQKARTLFEMVPHTDAPTSKHLKAKLRLICLRQKTDGGNLEKMLEPLVEHIQTVEDDEERADLCYMLASNITDYYQNIGDDDKALEFIGYGERLQGHINAHKSMRLLATKYDILLKHDHLAAMQCLDQALELAQAQDTGSEDTDWIAMALVDRGDYAYNESLDFDEAAHYYRLASEINTAPMAFDNPVKLAIARRLIAMLTAADEYERAIDLGEKIVAVATRNEVTETALWYVLELAKAYIENDDLDKAADLLDRYADDFARYPDTETKMLLEHANLLMAQGEDIQAVATITQLLTRPNLRHDTRMWAERSLAQAYSRLGDPRMEAWSDTVSRTAKREVMSHLWFISPLKRRHWLAFCREATNIQLSMPDNQRAIENAAELNLFNKSLLLHTTLNIEDAIASNPENAEELTALKTLRKALQTAITKSDSTVTAELRKEVDAKEQGLVNRHVDHSTFIRSLNPTISDVIANMDPNSVAVDFVWRKRFGHISVGAFIYAANMDCRYLPLIESDGELPSNTVSSIWVTLYPILSSYSSIYFCGDGDIHALPLEYALVDGKLISDLFSLHRVFHLANITPSSTIGDMVAFIGVADHNSPLGENEDTNRGNWTNLPNIEEELAAISQSIPADSLTVAIDDAATEQRIKLLDGSSVTTLHISTHGVYRSQEALQEAATDPSNEDYHMAMRMAAVGRTSLSGLVLRGGNQTWHSPQIIEEEDNLLTAEEIELMHFPRLQLTVLSACDTGLGDVDSEGVWGLQRAFRMAGTKSLICTLNKVDDYWTARFMGEFYRHAARGATIYDAFHTAHRWLRRELPDNPEVWQAFILIE